MARPVINAKMVISLFWIQKLKLVNVNHAILVVELVLNSKNVPAVM